ncbi:uncharacterized protein LOC141701229 [Apium graveolens]|uniref:Uncharacterized protein n=1 Tax=Apium graveolens TaxID=4045 RepID=A0A6L5BAN4_APIGR|nr:hypothetical protein AG4045_014379 [Apium graveolens]
MRGRSRKAVIIGLGVVMLMGISVYLRLWTIDYRISSEDTDLIRRQFDLANREAMDESAEWRLKYDQEFEKANNCANQLIQIKNSYQKKVKDAASNTRQLEMIQKENIGLLERVEALKQELETEKLKCSMKET